MPVLPPSEAIRLALKGIVEITQKPPRRLNGAYRYHFKPVSVRDYLNLLSGPQAGMIP
jgi:hypothetical protein